MDEEQLQLLYNSYASKKGFSDYNEFKSLINNEGSRKVFFESSNKELGFKSYDEFNNLVGLKKKEESKPTSQEKLWGSGSKPKDLYTSLVTDAPKKTTASVSLDGKPSPKKVVKEAPKEVVEEEDGLVDYLLNTIEFGIAQASKSVYDTPGFIYDQVSGLVTTPLINLGADILGVERPKEATSKSLAKSLGFENVPSNILKAKLAKINKKITEEEASYGGTVLDAMENKNYGGALAITIGSALKSAPAMVLAMGSGGGTAGMLALGYTSAATKSAQLEEEQPNLSVTDRALNATTSGAIEATLGQVFTGASGAATKKILQTSGKAGAKVISNAFVRIASKYVEKNPMVAIAGGLVEETGVAVLNQWNDIATGIRSEFNFKEALNEGVSSLGMSTTGTVLVYGAKGYVSNKKYRQVKSLNKNIDKFRKELDKEDISEESREFFKIKSDELEAKNKELLGSEIEKLKMLSNEDKALLNGSNKKIEAFSNSIDKIKNDKALSVEAKKIAIKEIIKDLSAAKKAKNDVISKAEAFEVTGDFSDFNGVPIDFDIETSGISSLPIDKQNSLNKEAFDALNKELNPTGKEQVDVTKEMVSKRASEMYDLEVSANKEAEATSVTEPVEKPVEPVKPSGQKVSSFLNRPATLESFAGSKLESPIEGDVYVEGQRVIFEGKDKKQYDLGNVDEISDNNVESLGILPIEKKFEITEEGKVSIDGDLWNVQSELPASGIEYDKDGNISAVSLKDDSGKTIMFDGQVAEDIGYQVLMSEYEKNKENYDKIIDEDAEISEQIGDVEETTETETDKDTQDGIGEVEEAKPVVKKETPLQEIKGNALDIFKAGLQAISITKATAKAKLKNLTDTINSLSQDENGKPKKGGLSIKQANSLIKRIGMLNLDNPKTTQKIIDYATKIIADSEYKDKLDGLDGIVSSIKKKIKSKDIDPELIDLVKKFVSLNPKDVDDVDSYLDIADNINKNIKGSTIVRDKLNVAKGIDKSSLDEYVNKELSRSVEKKAKDIVDSFFELTGLDPDEFNLEDIKEILNNQKEIKETKYSESEIKPKLKKAYDSLSAIVADIIKNKKDRFTGEKIDISTETKESFNKLKGIDFGLLSNKDALNVVDILNDIAVNGYSNKVDSFMKEYDGLKRADEFSKGKPATKLRLFFSSWAGKFWNKQIGSLYSVSENLFRGFNEGNDFMKAIGFDAVQKGASIAEMKVNQSFSKYSKKFLNTSPNKQSFNTEFNNAERTFLAMAKRFTPGKESEDFARNKSLIEQSIAVLSVGSELEIKSAAIQQKVYDKIFKNSNTKEDVISKADKINSEAVDEMSSYHKENFDKNAEATLKYYNTILNEEENYNTVKYSNLSGEKGTIDSDSFDSAIVNKDGKVYDKKAGVFNELKNPSKLRKGSYINTNFEANNEQAMKAALIDANTAGDIKLMKAFIYSDSFAKIIPNKSDRDLFIDRVKNFVDIKRGRNYPPINKEEISAINKATRSVSRIGAIKALGGITQLPKQTISVGASTLINSGKLSVMEAFDPKWNDFINNSGYEIATRGIHSSSDFVDIQDILRSVEDSKPKEMLDKLGKAQGVYLKWFLAKPDVFIAKASWISYYKEGLEKRGIDPNGIDISDHKINDDAAFYAQRQVDRQQNVSDTALEGKWLTSKDPGAELSRAVLLVFSKFALNQKSRMYSDFRTAFNLNSTSEDRKTALKSLVALSAEQAMFRTISATISVGIFSGVSSLMGYEESEEDKEKRLRSIIQGQLKSSVADYLSPVPFLDYPTQYVVAKQVDNIQEELGVEEKDKINIFPRLDTNYLDRFGMYGIVAKGGVDFYEFQKLAWTGKYSENGEEEELPIKTQNALRVASTGNILYHLGFLPSEFNSAFRSLEKIAKKQKDSEDGSDLFKNKKSVFGEGKGIFKNRKSLFK